jgi:hypothetical protein
MQLTDRSINTQQPGLKMQNHLKAQALRLELGGTGLAQIATHPRDYPYLPQTDLPRFPVESRRE